MKTKTMDASWGGKRSGAGRPAENGNEPMEVISVRVSPKQRQRFKAMGGAKMIRRLLGK